jgi:2-(1,2-epoxy-1,2-dihydrophenyl)acetyl-CoA isomerase
MSEAPVLVTVADGVATITLNRPQAGNAIDIGLASALLEVAKRCESEEEIRCVVIDASGRLFCAGGDIASMKAAGPDLPDFLQSLIETLHAAVTCLATMPKPLLTVINGPAAGAGFSLAILGDVVLSARSAHFTAAYGALGLTADGGLSWLLPRLVGLRKAQEIMLTNRRVRGDEGEAIGLVTRVVDDVALRAEAAAMAKRLADAPMASLGAARALLHESFGVGLRDQLLREQYSMLAAAAGPEFGEGLAAFIAKRSPEFRKA